MVFLRAEKAVLILLDHNGSVRKSILGHKILVCNVNFHSISTWQVKVGNLEFPIGHLKYEVIEPYKLPEYAIGAIAAGGGFLIIVTLVILFVYRRKSSQAEREYKRIQIQMDTLESNVRSECKQGNENFSVVVLF